MFSIDLMSRSPVYEQIIDQTERFILTGLLKSGDKMPSVRVLSVSLSVNPNTIQRAYSELDSKGIIVTVQGRGAFISDKALDLIGKRSRKKLTNLENNLTELRLAGVTREEIIEVVDKIFNERKMSND